MKRGGLATSLSITALYLPFVFRQQGWFSPVKFDNTMEVLLFNVVAATLGLLRDREADHQRRLREAESLAAMGTALSSRRATCEAGCGGPEATLQEIIILATEEYFLLDRAL